VWVGEKPLHARSVSERNGASMLGIFDNPVHILMVLVVVLLLFGAKWLPEMGRSLGAGLRGFKESVSGETTTASADEITRAGD
jgi:sec-independent protein translocase protein TatA